MGMESGDIQKPKEKFKAGRISAAIFEKEMKKNDGSGTFTKTNVNLQRSYKDKEENWQNQNISLDVNDIPRAILCLEEAHRSLLLKSTDDE